MEFLNSESHYLFLVVNSCSPLILAELFHPTENQGYYSSYSPDCNGEIRMGENKTCIITNDDIPKGCLIVIKNVINDNSGTANAFDFTMYVLAITSHQVCFKGLRQV